MGFKISWIGFENLPKEEVLQRLGLRDTNEHDEANEAPFSVATLPNGWTVVFVNDFEFASSERIELLSRSTTVVACQLHEGIMVSSAHGVRDGQRMWSILHDCAGGIFDLTVEGHPPPPFAQIKDRLFYQQREQGGEQAEIDFIFDIPLELAEALTSYRHDRWNLDLGEPHFTIAKHQAMPEQGKPSIWKQLFGR